MLGKTLLIFVAVVLYTCPWARAVSLKTDKKTIEVKFIYSGSYPDLNAVSGFGTDGLLAIGAYGSKFLCQCGVCTLGRLGTLENMYALWTDEHSKAIAVGANGMAMVYHGENGFSA